MRGRLPADRVLVALCLVVAVTCACWALLVPPWQGPDEPPHFSYVETLVREHDVPRGDNGEKFSRDLHTSLTETNANGPIGILFATPEWSPARAATTKALTARQSQGTGGGRTESSNNPPAYYLWNVPAYAVVGSQATTTRLYAMRLWNIPLVLINVIAIWALIGELVGRRPLAQLAGAATVGLWPMVTFLAGTVNPDVLLFSVWSVAFATGARIAVRGLTLRRGVALGLVVGLGFLTKAPSLALMPPTVLLLGWAWWRGRAHGHARRASVAVGSAAALLALPVLWTVVSRALGESAYAQVAQASGSAGGASFNARQALSYLWQFYLPRLGFMAPFDNFIPVISTRPVLNTWLGTGTGTFGWVSTWFRPFVYWIVGACLVGATALAGLGMALARRRGVRLGAGRRAAMLYVVLSALLIIAGTHLTDYRLWITSGGFFAQGRYILPGVLPALALVVAAAVVTLRRHGGVLAGLWVGALFGLQAASLALIVTRWYVATA